MQICDIFNTNLIIYIYIYKVNVISLYIYSICMLDGLLLLFISQISQVAGNKCVLQTFNHARSTIFIVINDCNPLLSFINYSYEFSSVI